MSPVKDIFEAWQKTVRYETHNVFSTAIDSNTLEWGGKEEDEPVVVVAVVMVIVVAVEVMAVVVGVSTYREDIRSDWQSVELQCESSF